ncbi:uncharacterized protein KGF55_000410 [Candida pseudojiufengensis]|uniref:uncharacterized protein n=1 Tax=Candida pseudojiufengensis TaxID=497109 RepID=UPI0022243CC8|nr:uncharacterized protein KGF55_000410 [Candida pseudojiufengensis]KAI5967001.1 hypothetical protein KGF55_000410 [Candida pseudojiufengensis]
MCASELREPYYEALPTNLKPIHYDLSIYDINLKNDTFKGEVSIDLDVLQPTNELILNYRDISVTKEDIKVTNNGDNIKIDSIEENKSKEYFIIKFNQTVESGKLNVIINYNAIIQTNMAGFYKSSYEDQGVTKYMLSTQFEATDARRAFPCLDEPLLKSTFKVKIIGDSNWTFLSNTPVESETEIENGLKQVKFEQTPIMSTYLLAWACGEFEYIESFTKENYNGKPLPVRIYTTKGGYIEDAKLASEITPKIVDYFSKIFEIKYPLSKLDLIAVHSFSHNAMENWGLITYRSTALLYNSEKSDPSYKQKVAYVVAHELAHQWFGNLVTMKWWDELWLNEGFATWVGYTAVDYLYPEWDIFSEFVSTSLEQALELDGLRNSHPIEVPVVDALDIDQVFDAISYLKGASTILMISKYLGTNLFLKGVALYLKTNKYSNATSQDLWNAISEVSGKPVDKLMNTWIKEVGFPIVNVGNFEDGLKFSQSRFLNGGDVSEEDTKSKWWIPLNILSENSIGIDSFDKYEIDYKNYQLGDSKFKINKDTSGVYRVKYSDDILEKNVIPYFEEFSSRDQVGIIADFAATACSGNNSTVKFLKFINTIVPKLKDDYVVWLELGKNLGNFANVFTSKDSNESIKTFLQNVYSKKAIEIIEDLQKNKIDDSDFLKVKFRSEILTKAGRLDIPKVYEFALELFNNPTTIHPSLRLFVYTAIASSSNFTQEQFNEIMKQVTNPTSLDSRELALTALGSTINPEFIEKLLNSLIDPKILPPMDSHFLGKPLSLNSKTKYKFLDFFLQHYDSSFYKIMSTNMVVLDRFIKITLRNYSLQFELDKINNFFKSRDIHGFERALKQALDNIKINENWLIRDREEVEKFLTKLD